MSVGIKINKEEHMKAGKTIKINKLTLKVKARLNFKFKFIVVAMVGCLMVAPLTKAYN